MRLLPCPKCEGLENRTVDGRPNGGLFRRRRECQSCRHRWTTWEIPDERMTQLLDSEATLHRLCLIVKEVLPQ